MAMGIYGNDYCFNMMVGRWQSFNPLLQLWWRGWRNT